MVPDPTDPPASDLRHRYFILLTNRRELRSLLKSIGGWLIVLFIVLIALEAPSERSTWLSWDLWRILLPLLVGLVIAGYVVCLLLDAFRAGKSRMHIEPHGFEVVLNPPDGAKDSPASQATPLNGKKDN
jgi:hypothetical protein